jgi:hypothetical protein
MNMQEAADRADSIFDTTFSAIKPAVQWTHTYSVPGDCYVDRERSVMTIISAQRRSSFLGVVERHWKSAGYKFVAASENGLAANFKTQDGFQLQVLIGTNGQAHFQRHHPVCRKIRCCFADQQPKWPGLFKGTTACRQRPLELLVGRSSHFKLIWTSPHLSR